MTGRPLRGTMGRLDARPCAVILALVAVMAGCRRQAPSSAAKEAPETEAPDPASQSAEARNPAEPVHIVYPGAPASFTDVLDKVGPSVVTIRATAKVVGGPGAVYPGAGDARSLGAGFIVSRDGYILTTAHILARAPEVHVVLAGGEEVPATIAGRDPVLDVGLLKIEASPALTPIRLGDSDAVRAGQWVAALGNPFGHGPTLSVGVVSAKMPAPSLATAQSTARGLLQTDADITPANSGGPLINLAGEAVGINTAIENGAGIGFAIPISRAAEILPQLKRDGRVKRAWLGVFVHPVTAAVAKKARLPDEDGALVSRVVPSGPAAKAGLKPGDIIIAVNGEPITFDKLPYLTARAEIGKAMAVKVWRRGSEVSVTLVPAPMPR